ncbi:unnamed protein product [Adineta ricciae]|uniref:Uncharacterized protein n=1 Tax=Adineta ricciae TaxID=249248 RepID=A0A813Z4M2_ADIRI|nr:unnamed protein product [Adineta ricciae]
MNKNKQFSPFFSYLKSTEQKPILLIPIATVVTSLFQSQKIANIILLKFRSYLWQTSLSYAITIANTKNI